MSIIIFPNGDNFPFEGLWTHPDNSEPVTIFYAIKDPMAFRTKTKSGIEGIYLSGVISVFGEHMFQRADTITLQDGTVVSIGESITNNYRLPHRSVRKFIRKMIVDSQDIEVV